MTFIRNNIWNRQTKPKMNGIELSNPLPDMVQDLTDLTKNFRDFALIPYMGDSQQSFHTYVELLDKLHMYSPTQGTITKSIMNAAFGGCVVAREFNDGFGLDKGTNEAGRANEFYQFLKDCGFSGHNVSNMAETLYSTAKPTGNAYVLAEFMQVAGERSVSFRIYDQKTTTRLVPENDERLFLVTERLFDNQYWSNPDTWNIYPEFTGIDDLEFDDTGTAYAMFHFKHKGYDNNWYALPDTFHAIYAHFNEWQQWDGLLKEADNLFLGRLLLFYEDCISQHANSREEALKQVQKAMITVQDRINNSVTMGGNGASAVTALTYGSGSKPPTHVTLPSNTNEKWHKTISEENSRAIYSANCWSPLLTGAEKPSASLSGHTMIETMEMFDRSTVRPVQRHMTGFMMSLFNAMAEFKGNDISGLELGFVTPFQQKLQDAKDAATQFGEGG